MEGYKFFKIIFSFSSFLLLIIFFMSCQSPLFQTKYEAKNDLLTNSQYYGQYISKNNVSQNQDPNEKLNVIITNDIVTKEDNGKTTTATNSIYIWIGSSAIPVDENEKIIIENSNIDGVAPHYAFNNDEVVGKLTIINNNVITITFASLFPPYLNIQNVTCNKTNKTS